ncbi:thioredoxin family protein [Ekhidna sp.]|uniref:thioredoxin family protein n=1 Tax=Ekhidna sp. TaxID=2608089 RepID=UPI003CCBA924
MKKIIIVLLLTVIGSPLFSQVNWTRDMKIAQAMALTNNQFIVMDFWASWCGPCKKMDSDMWNTEEMAAYNDKFVFLKVDVDQYSSLAMSYQANSIPKVVVIDPTGTVLWNEVGYRNSAPYFKILDNLPSAPLPSTDLGSIIRKENIESASFNVGAWYQKEGAKLEDPMLAKDFFELSDQYFKTASKSDKDQLAKEAEYNLVLNYAYKGNIKKAMKKVEKMDETDMKNFILAYCYKCEGQDELMQKFSEKIESEELLARLDN